MTDTQQRTMPYPAIAVANSLIEIAESNGKKLDPMKLQKLVYYAHGWFMVFQDRPLINEEIQAWRYGPVIRSVYYYFKRYGAISIDGPAKVSEADLCCVPPEDTLTHALLQEVWRVYGKYRGVQLSTMSHSEGTPWDKAWSRNQEHLESVVIPNDDIKKHFKSILEKSGAHD